MKKRITLVRNFKEIIESGDMKTLEDVFEKCDINATGGYGKGTALHFYDLPEEMIRRLVAMGADVNAVNTYGNTPLHVAASLYRGKIGVFIELGASIQIANKNGNTPLHAAAGSGYNVENVKLLIDHGADIFAINSSEQTPLEYALRRTQNSNIEAMANIAEILLTVQRNITEEMKQAVTEIGESFEFYRADFNPDYLAQTEAALEHLYELFHVTPVDKRPVFDLTSQIQVKVGTWQSQFNELWALLVPGRGSVSTVQGEVIRICGKVSREILDNGAPNWSRKYKKLPQALPKYFAMGNSLEHSIYIEAEKLAKGISANSDEKSIDRLCELAVKWVLANPMPIPLDKVDYDR